MKVYTNFIMFDEGEPAFRSCPQCNGMHEHLAWAKVVHLCFSCGRYWLNGRYLDDIDDADQRAFFMQCEKDGCAVQVIDAKAPI